MSTQPVTLTVPDGLFPGMEMSVAWGGVDYSIAVPDGVGPGMEITVELPALDEAPPPPEQMPEPTGAPALPGAFDAMLSRPLRRPGSASPTQPAAPAQTRRRTIPSR